MTPLNNLALLETIVCVTELGGEITVTPHSNDAYPCIMLSLIEISEHKFSTSVFLQPDSTTYFTNFILAMSHLRWLFLKIAAEAA